MCCSGLDNQCSIYQLNRKNSVEDRVTRISHPSTIIAQHAKYVTQCAFFGSDQQLLTCSADTTCALWDLEMSNPVQTFKGHKKEVLGCVLRKYFLFCVDSFHVPFFNFFNFFSNYFFHSLSLHPKDPCSIFASSVSKIYSFFCWYVAVLFFCLLLLLFFMLPCI